MFMQRAGRYCPPGSFSAFVTSLQEFLSDKRFLNSEPAGSMASDCWRYYIDTAVLNRDNCTPQILVCSCPFPSNNHTFMKKIIFCQGEAHYAAAAD